MNNKYQNKFLLEGHLGANANKSPKCFMGSIYHRKDGKAITMAKFKAFGGVVAKLVAIPPHTLISVTGAFAPVEGYTDKKGVFHQPEMILVVSDVKVLEQPKTKEQLVKEAAQKDAALAAQAAEIAALKAALVAQQGVTASPQQNVEMAQPVKEEPKVEVQPEKVVLKPIAPEEVGPLVNFQGATEMAPSEPEIVEDINPAELLPPPGFEEHVDNAEMQAIVDPQEPQVVQPTQTKKGLPSLKFFEEIPAGIFNMKMTKTSTAVKAEEKITVPDQPVEYKKECPFA